MKNFFKENAVLVAGIALPLMLALVFFMATRVSEGSGEPPTTAVVFTTGYYDSNVGYGFDVKDNKLVFRFNKPDYNSHMQKPRLYIYEPSKKAVREIELPDIDNTKKSASAPVPGVGKLNTLEKSPDGFVFEQGSSGGGSNLMTELFGGGSRYRNQCIMRKDVYRHVLPDVSDYSCRFIGWVVE